MLVRSVYYIFLLNRKPLNCCGIPQFECFGKRIRFALTVSLNNHYVGNGKHNALKKNHSKPIINCNIRSRM